ncbi:hypothetical protein H6G80_10605 [Nostoc sp. FACHB-87]|uniref:hypothetical protein n=1 Tax=Nostocales TaxID=1161 RepID=UPI001686BB16|nr:MULTISPECIES: hypothetical protein [Nostocales]MBD2301715.1 hypothetical protein [Nostoc sp. FACHB-190]MBD2454529.1 hypothetical protein [Nostoc sp. FACHB-87]MBD2479094.1 hypothetical protein [Anabaena sp. FACHB-83]MBD2490934.1 hypothetical protein [Aulosira sp. FACHB-615]
MANITLSELNAAGSQLFQDSESFLNDLSDFDAIATQGADGSYISDFYGFNKLIEGFVDVYAIQHIFGIAKSFSKGGYSNSAY